MATRRGIVKKTSLKEYSRPRTGGIIGITLKEGDQLIDVALTQPGDEVVLATKMGRPFASTRRRPRHGPQCQRRQGYLAEIRGRGHRHGRRRP